MKSHAARSRILKDGICILGEQITIYWDNPILNRVETEKVAIKGYISNSGDKGITDFFRSTYPHIKIK